MFENSKWIWVSDEERADEYVDFFVDFYADNKEKICLNIAVDGNFEAYLNGELCAFGSCADYPAHKHYDSFDIGKYCTNGKNTLKITVWHIGMPSMTYAMSNAGLIYSVTSEGKEIATSGENTLCRRNESYTNGLCRMITGQLGPTYRYDNTVTNNSPFAKSVTVDKSYEITPRGIENLKLLPRISVEIADDGKRLLIDWGKEAVGYLDLDFISEGEQELLISFGEHLDDNGRVPRIIGQRDFSIGFVAKDGRNTFFGGMRRIAGRYFEIEYQKPIKVDYIGIRPVIYPVSIKEKSFENALHQKIYDISVYTLLCCMHEHYEDCPWREQALYSLDSRNQMLCGYIAFDEYKYARYNIVLLSEGLNKGIIRITSPSDINLAIPFFSLTFIQQVYEYVKFSKDESIVGEVKHVLDTIVSTFVSHIDETGLIPALPPPAWNFYEWSDGNNGHRPAYPESTKYDLCLNSMFIYAYDMYKQLGGKVTIDIASIRDAVMRELFDIDSGLFKTSTADSRFSIIGNSLAILAGIGDKRVADKLINKRKELIDVTLSMNAYFYDALLSLDNSFNDYIVKDIEEKYSYMLSEGATTFWETIEGWRAFTNAGSLCHGWSALPVYYLNKLI